MPRPEADQEAAPSVLDRLIDDGRGTRARPPTRRRGRSPGSRTRSSATWNGCSTAGRSLADLPADLGQLGQSLLTFGLPDFTSPASSNVDDQDAPAQAIEEAIRRFEPGSRGSGSTLESRAASSTAALRFRIDAMLKVEPEPEPVTFDSVLQLEHQGVRRSERVSVR